jgi:hypothetical protein
VPASLLLLISISLPKKYRECIEQEILDLRIEYKEALEDKNVWKARCLVVFYYAGLSWTLVRWIAQGVKKLAGFIPKVH